MECLYCVELAFIHSAKSYIRHSDHFYSNKHQHSDKSLKVKFKALKELENGTPYKDVASLFGAPEKTLSTWKKSKEKIF